VLGPMVVFFMKCRYALMRPKVCILKVDSPRNQEAGCVIRLATARFSSPISLTQDECGGIPNDVPQTMKRNPQF